MNCIKCGKFKTNDSTLCSDCQVPETTLHQISDWQSVPLTKSVPYPPNQADPYAHAPWQAQMPQPPFYPAQAQKKSSGKVWLAITLTVVFLGALGAMMNAARSISNVIEKSNTIEKSNAPTEPKTLDRSAVASEGKVPEKVTRTKVMTSSDGRMQISLPEGWEKESKPNEGSILHMVNNADDVFLLVFVNRKVDLNNPTFERFDEMAKKNFLKPDIPREIISYTRMTINGYPASQWEARAKLNNINLIYLHTTIETEDAYYEVNACTRPSLYEGNLPSIQEIIQTFQEAGAQERL
jgi:hypothetical protein